jgi:hypothetical protein
MIERIAKYNDTEQLFIREMLDMHGEYIMDLIIASIEKKDIIDEGNLLNSLSYKVKKSGNDYSLLLSFEDYGRFIEIRSNKKRFKSLRPNDVFKEYGTGRKPKRKDVSFYAKNVFGAQNRLMRRLSSEYTADEIARLKNILANSISKTKFTEIKTTAI